MADIVEKQNIETVDFSKEMRKSYLEYAMSVIISRALPDVRDGLKPVHRRIVYAMLEGGYVHSKPFRKSARIVGDVMGKYHPHGDSAIYEAMVRMAQDFSLRLPLIKGQGNFGSMDGDGAAAMRYTEAKLSLAAHALIHDIEKETVEFRPNYDESILEPSVLPSRFPNLLVNGASGIAVGMATNILPHNLGELTEACLAILENPDISVQELTQYIKGPDFPTGGTIVGTRGLLSALTTGRGSIIVRAKSTIQEMGQNKSRIIINEIPWQVNKSKLVEDISRIKQKVDQDYDVISAIRDESDRHGVRIVIELKRGEDPNVLLNTLYKNTSLQTSYAVNMLAIDNNVPKLMNSLTMLKAFLDFRFDVIKKRTLFLLKKAREKAHTLTGLGVAVANIDEVIELIKNAPNPSVAKEQLMAKNWQAFDIVPLIKLVEENSERLFEDGTYRLSEIQAKAILELRLHRLTGLEREQIKNDLENIVENIKEYLEILNNKERMKAIVVEELHENKQFTTPRKTDIIEDSGEFNQADFVQKEDVVVIMTNQGYIKRIPVNSYNIQRRGGKGKMGMNIREEDAIKLLFLANTHQELLFFTKKGMVYKQLCYSIPETSSQALGKFIANIINIEKDDTITNVVAIPEKITEELSLVFATKNGKVRKSDIKDFLRVNSSGKIAIKLEDKDSLIGVKVCSSDEDIFLSTKQGKSIRFALEGLRVIASRSSSGVNGINLRVDDEVVNLSSVKHEKLENLEIRDNYLKYKSAQRRGEEFEGNILSEEEIKDLEHREEFILTISSKGYGKQTSAYEYRISNRGGMGVTAMSLNNKIGHVVDAFEVKKDDDIIMVSGSGQVIRCPAKQIRVVGRNSKGVTLFSLTGNDEVVSVSKVSEPENNDEETNGEDKGNSTDNSGNNNNSGSAGFNAENSDNSDNSNSFNQSGLDDNQQVQKEQLSGEGEDNSDEGTQGELFWYGRVNLALFLKNNLLGVNLIGFVLKNNFKDRYLLCICNIISNALFFYKIIM